MAIAEVEQVRQARYDCNRGDAYNHFKTDSYIHLHISFQQTSKRIASFNY